MEIQSRKITVLVVDDSLTIRKKIAEILNATADIVVVGEAANGKEAIEFAQKLHPTVILMDIIMPVMSGLSAIEYIMSTEPTAIVVHSSSITRGELYKTWDAMKVGALIRIDKDLAGKDPDVWRKELILTVRSASRVKIIQRRTNTQKPYNNIYLTQAEALKTTVNIPYNLIAFGASTGGPGVVANILKTFPATLNIPILLVIHLADTQQMTFAEWLNDNCKLETRFATGDEWLFQQGGRVLIAPPDKHMIVIKDKIKLVDSPPVNYCKPSVDVLFESISHAPTLNPIAILLTGIGKDGAVGMRRIKENGGFTICQDEATSVVYGMPKAAVDLNAADIVLPDYKIPPHILSLIHPT